MSRPSPFLDPGSRTAAGDLAIVQLSRDNLLPIILQETDGASDGYAEGVVLNTRFGSFPHSTLVGVPWGSQIRASDVDTGSRGRKRKRGGTYEESNVPDSTSSAALAPAKKAIAAASGFIHILPPTPELWTLSLPHRTQVVYTPDYSYILQRIRARPGTRLIEAGAGSGSFTHASARAVYNGYPTCTDKGWGKVFSFEFHRPRYEKMSQELTAHGLDGIVSLAHRDVCQDGFVVAGKSPAATAVFLDLPAPWDALPHLSRRRPTTAAGHVDSLGQWVSPLDPTRSVHLCTFSPCIEQVTRTISAMRTLGWMEIEMVEISHKKLSVVRDKVNDRNTQPPADVSEAVARLRELEKNAREYHGLAASGHQPGQADEESAKTDIEGNTQGPRPGARITDSSGNASGASKPWAQGRITHRTEAELKMHTSYLVFAILPREWSQEDEAAALARWPCGAERKVIGSLSREARKAEKREFLKGKKKANAEGPPSDGGSS